jgi:phosphatidylglycerol:prolipoprotein diacylglycerol transferase
MTVYPLTLHIGPLAITGYGIMMMAAFLMAGWAIQLELRRRKLDEEYAADIVIAAVIGGLLGAKIWYVAVTGQWGALLSRGGLVWYGGFFGGVAAVLANGWRKRVPLRFTCEVTAPALALGYALGRVGCFLVNDDYGLPTSLPWGMKFPLGLPPSSVAELIRAGATIPAGMAPSTILAVHPTQIYETLIMLVAFAWLWKRRAHAHGVGWLFGVYLMIAGAERFLVEFIRAKDDRFFGQFSLAQVTSIALIAFGFLLTRKWSAPDQLGARLPEFLPQRAATEPRPAGKPAGPGASGATGD